jgi:hypothetical protein
VNIFYHYTLEENALYIFIYEETSVVQLTYERIDLCTYQRREKHLVYTIQ